MTGADSPGDELAPESRILRKIDEIFRKVPGARTETLALRELLEREAQALVAAQRAGHDGAPYLIRGQFRAGPGMATDSELMATVLAPEEARQSIARWHWFSDWSEAQSHAHEIVDCRFEAACDAIVDGDAARLQSLLAQDPSLVHARSRFAHHQTLLQHVSANGIENSRQWQSPRNAVAIAEILLAAGAEPDATCDSYGGGSTAMTLLVSSAHPARTGVQAGLVEALCKAGAKPDGPADDGMPLWTAISFGYSPAVDALVRCGARVDNLLFAAAAGDLALVASYFDDAGRLVPARAHSWGSARALAQPRPAEKTLHLAHILEYALHQAAIHRRRSVVAYLLTRSPDLSIREPLWNNTPLESAEYGGDPEIIALLKRA